MKKITIQKVKARQILDSRGNPTVETAIWLSTGEQVVASVPSGKSVGKHEAVEIRDNNPQKYSGQGVLKAVAIINEIIAPKIIGQDPNQQQEIDQLMIDLDGTENKSKLGANAIIAVSQAVCEAGAKSRKMPIYQQVADLFGLPKNSFKIPVPLFNLINGGAHGTGNLDFQEFHVIPFKNTFAEALETGDEIYQATEKVLIKNKAIHSVGDEGGYAPDLFSNIDALEILVEAIKNAGEVFGKDLFLGLDVAANFFYKKGKYQIRDRTSPLDAADLIAFYKELNKRYPLYLIEDPLEEDDWLNWKKITAELEGVLVVGDDLLTTNQERVNRAIKNNSCNAILVKPNQVGTISETILVVKAAQAAKWKVIVSHRSGETNDDFIADFGVGVGADFVKFGAPARGERVVKYNRLLAIEEKIKSKSS